MKILNGQTIVAKGRKYRLERWQGKNPFYIFNSLEEDYTEPIEKTYEEVEQLVKNKIITII